MAGLDINFWLTLIPERVLFSKFIFKLDNYPKLKGLAQGFPEYPGEAFEKKMVSSANCK